MKFDLRSDLISEVGISHRQCPCSASVKDFFDFFWQIVEKEVNSFSQRFDFSEVRKTLFDITKCDCSLNKNKVYFKI